LTLNGFEGHLQPLRSAILATGRFLVTL